MQAKLKIATLSMCYAATAGIYALVGAGPAQAQMSHTNCMAMGSGMMSCDTMQMGGSSANDGGYALGEGIGALIAKGRENSFRKKIGQMLANGDCEGASRFAFEKGRIEMGTDIAQSCKRRPMAAAYASKQPSNAPSAIQPLPIPPGNLENALRNAAAAVRTPVVIDDITTISKVEAIGTQLLLIADLKGQGVPFTDEKRIAAVNEICALEEAQPLMRAGASVRIVYKGMDGKQIGAAMATRKDCGL